MESGNSATAGGGSAVQRGADKLFFKRALEEASRRAGDFSRCQMTQTGRATFLGMAEEAAPPPPAARTPVRRFQPPTEEEVAAYCQERGNGIDPAAFIDHYAANGWMAGRVKMKDWKAAVRTWERVNRERGECQTAGKVKRWVATTQPAESSLDLHGFEAELLRRRPVFLGGEEP